MDKQYVEDEIKEIKASLKSAERWMRKGGEYHDAEDDVADAIAQGVARAESAQDVVEEGSGGSNLIPRVNGGQAEVGAIRIRAQDIMQQLMGEFRASRGRTRCVVALRRVHKRMNEAAIDLNYLRRMLACRRDAEGRSEKPAAKESHAPFEQGSYWADLRLRSFGSPVVDGD